MSKKKPESTYHSVMLIDDNEIDNFINQKMIEGCAFADHVHIHTSSKSALEFLDNLQRGGESIPESMIPGMIFLDINMPILDGFQFMEEFEKLPGNFRSKIKIVMLSTSINPSDMEKAEKHELIQKFLNKPLNEKHLASITAKPVETA